MNAESILAVADIVFLLAGLVDVTVSHVGEDKFYGELQITKSDLEYGYYITKHPPMGKTNEVVGELLHTGYVEGLSQNFCTISHAFVSRDRIGGDD